MEIFLGPSDPIIKRAKSSEESITNKRKRSDDLSSARDNGTLSKSISNDESTKKPKSNTLLQRDSLTVSIKYRYPKPSSLFQNSPTHCIVHGCNNLSKFGWVYCSSACIRRHINDTLQAIQRSKGMV